MTPEAREVMERIKAHEKLVQQWKYGYMAEHPDLHSYSMLTEDLFYSFGSFLDVDIPLAERAFAALSAANPGHPYNQTVGDRLNALKYIVPGGRFIDFTAPALDGTVHTLSKEIAGKVAVIDLWASWCGPCRINGRNIVPLYEKYKDKGFTVVGIAREFKTTDALVKAIESEGYPWLNLVELDDSGGIWSKYGASNGPGRVVLVDESGRVIIPDAKAKDIEEYLSSRFD